MANYKVHLNVTAAMKASVEKKLRQAFGNQAEGVTWNVEKVKNATTRADRLGEAEALVEDAKGQVEELRSEMEEWRDSVPENLQGSDKYSSIEECISQLEDIESNLDQCDFSSVEFPGMMG